MVLPAMRTKGPFYFFISCKDFKEVADNHRGEIWDGGTMEYHDLKVFRYMSDRERLSFNGINPAHADKFESRGDLYRATGNCLPPPIFAAAFLPILEVITKHRHSLAFFPTPSSATIDPKDSSSDSEDEDEKHFGLEEMVQLSMEVSKRARLH